MLGRAATWAVAGALVVSSTAWAAGNANQGALPSGHAAGVKQAERFGGQWMWWVGGALVIGGVVLVATGNGHGDVGATCPLAGCTPPPTTTTTTTPTATTTSGT